MPVLAYLRRYAGVCMHRKQKERCQTTKGAQKYFDMH